jgi:histidinol dehydrogenase
MLHSIDLRSSRSFTGLNALRPRASTQKIEDVVTGILRRVESDGDAAVRFYTKKFDGIDLKSFAVSRKEISEALVSADPGFVRILRSAARNIRKFHERQRRGSWGIKERKNSSLRQLYLPVDKAGVYVPGGKAAYPSTVLMNVIPAQVAGVKEILIVSPPDRDGKVHKDVLTAAAILGITNIFRVGGAQAIAALAYGTRTIPAVDVIVGPGNLFVATAKKMVFGTVGIDNVAGPSEVVILADGSAHADFVASDMLAQAEHDESASSILVTTSDRLARDVQSSLKKLLLTLARKRTIAASLKRSGAIYLVKDLTQGARVVNHLAPEHLEIVTHHDENTLKKIRHAGSIFLGSYSPVVIGDYFAGPNHVLPTNRTARFASPLSVDSFMKKSSVIKYSRAMMRSVARSVASFADHEGLTAHAFSARLRSEVGR